MKTAIVIGNGFVGACIALALQRAGVAVTLVDVGDEKAAASHGNAGHLAVEQCDPIASRANVLSLHRRLFAFGGPVAFPWRDVGAWLPFGLRLLQATSPARFANGQRALGGLLGDAIGAWLRLAAHVGAPQLICADGHYVVWESTASGDAGLKALQSANMGTAQVAKASAYELQALRERFAGKPVAAAKFSNTGQVLDLRAMRGAIRTAFEQAGGRVRVAKVRTVNTQVVLDNGGALDADGIVVAAGIGSAQLLRGLCGPEPLIAERGYHVEAVTDSQPTPNGIHVVFEDRNIIAAPFVHSLRLSGFTEFSRAASPPDARKWAVLKRHAAELGMFRRDAALTEWVGSRPTLPDYLPAIGQLKDQPKVFYAFGHNHLGVTLAATTAEQLVAIMLGTTPARSLTPFSIDRFN